MVTQAAHRCWSVHIQSAREFTSATHHVMSMISLWSDRTKRGVGAVNPPDVECG
jgi:hypothetical protein